MHKHRVFFVFWVNTFKCDWIFFSAWGQTFAKTLNFIGATAPEDAVHSIDCYIPLCGGIEVKILQSFVKFKKIPKIPRIQKLIVTGSVFW